MTFQQGAEARDQRVKRERLDGSRAYPGAKTTVDVPQALVSTAPSAWLGSWQMCQVLPDAGQTSCELSAGLLHPLRNLQLPEDVFIHSFIHSSIYKSPACFRPMQDAKNMGVLRIRKRRPQKR